MKWLCTVDGSDGSVKGHGTHYVCSSCGAKKVNYSEAESGISGPVIGRKNLRQTWKSRTMSQPIRRGPKRKVSTSAKCDQGKTISMGNRKKALAAATKKGHKQEVPTVASKKGHTKKALLDGNKKVIRKKASSKKLQCDVSSPVSGAVARAISLQEVGNSPIAQEVFEKSIHHLLPRRDVDNDACSDDSTDEIIEHSVEASSSNSSAGDATSHCFNDELEATDNDNSDNDTGSDIEYTCESSIPPSSSAEDEFNGDVADKLQESWDKFELVQLDANLCIHNNNYLNKLFVSGGIHVNHSSKVLSIMRGDDCELELFFLFLTKAFFSAVRKWMIDKLNSSHQSRVKCLKVSSSEMFYAYIGLELGMSIISYNDIEQY